MEPQNYWGEYVLDHFQHFSRGASSRRESSLLLELFRWLMSLIVILSMWVQKSNRVCLGGQLLSRILDLRTALRTETGCHMVRTGDRGPEKGGRFL